MDEKKSEKKTSARIHTAHLEEDDSLSSALEFDEKSMTLEIKDKEPKIHENDNLKPKQKVNKNYLFYYVLHKIYSLIKLY